VRAPHARCARGSGNGLWDRPQLLNLISDTLMVVGRPGSAMPPWPRLSRLPVYPLREVVVTTPLAQVTTRATRIRRTVVAAGQFLHRRSGRRPRSFEKLPWVRRADVRRRWPGGIEVRLEEHVASAYWRVGETGDMRLVNRYGEVFTAASNAKMPVFSGPEGSSGVLLAKFDEFSGKLGPLGKQLDGVSLSAREAWQLKMEDGLTIELGHDQAKAPIDERLAASWAITESPDPTEHERGGGGPPLPRWFCPSADSGAGAGGQASQQKREVMSKEYKELIVGLDIGTSKITCVVAELCRTAAWRWWARLAAVLGSEEGRRGEYRGHRRRHFSGSSRKWS
jgi:cell division protein FtsQ